MRSEISAEVFLKIDFTNYIKQNHNNNTSKVNSLEQQEL